MHLFVDVDDFFAPVTGLIADIGDDDPRTRELPRTIVDDEYATVRWFRQMHEAHGGRAARA